MSVKLLANFDFYINLVLLINFYRSDTERTKVLIDKT